MLTRDDNPYQDISTNIATDKHTAGGGDERCNFIEISVII